MLTTRLTPVRTPTARRPRRRTLVALIGVIAVGALGAACGDDDPQTTSADEDTADRVERQFVGEADGYFVAAIADDKNDTVRLYVCNGNGETGEWFAAAGLDADGAGTLTSDDGDATATLAVADVTITGSIELANGTNLDVELGPADGLAGLYTITVDEDGTVTGTGALGGTVTGTRSAAANADGYYPTSITITNGGDTETIAVLTPDREPAELRTIYLPGVGEQLLGVGKTKTSTIKTTWIDPEPEPWTDPDIDPFT